MHISHWQLCMVSVWISFHFSWNFIEWNCKNSDHLNVFCCWVRPQQQINNRKQRHKLKQCLNQPQQPTTNIQLQKQVQPQQWTLLPLELWCLLLLLLHLYSIWSLPFYRSFTHSALFVFVHVSVYRFCFILCVEWFAVFFIKSHQCEKHLAIECGL